jgi:Bacterial Ig-like domain
VFYPCGGFVGGGRPSYKVKRKVTMKQPNPFVALFILSLALFLVSCGGTTTKPQPNSTDKTAPTLASSLPAQGASAVPINAKLALAFSKAMDEGSLELTSNPPITLSAATWNPDSTSVAFGNDTLSASTTYSLSLKAKDVSGNALAQTTLSFSTSDTADIAAPTTPTGLVATPANGKVTLTWQDNPEPDVAGYTLYMGTTQDKLEAKEFITTNSKTLTDLTNSTQYFFAVDAVDNANNHSGKTTPISATPSATVTDTTPPTIQSSDPADNATDVRGEVGFSIVFSEPMDKSSLSVTLNPPEYSLNLVNWSDNDTVLTLSPARLQLFEQTESTAYTLLLNATDKAGNALSGDKEISFTTGFEVPTLVSSDPANGAIDIPATEDVIIGGITEIILTFSEGVDTDKFEIDFNSPYTCLISKSETVSETVRLGCPLYDGNTYTLSYKGQDLDLHDFSGSISFSTVPDTVAPSVLVISPNDLAVDVPLATPIEIWFDDEMDETSTLAAVSSSPDVGCTWSLNITKDTLECSPTNLQGNTTYTITVAETAKDTSGKNLVGAGACRGTPPCSYEFMFSTIVTATTGSLGVSISGAPSALAKVNVTGPNGYSSGNLSSSTTLSDLEPGTYTVIAKGFGTGQLGKPTCKIYTPEPTTQTATVSAGQTATASVSYSSEPCPDLEP